MTEPHDHEPDRRRLRARLSRDDRRHRIALLVLAIHAHEPRLPAVVTWWRTATAEVVS